MTTQDLDVGFRVLKLADTNMKDVYYARGRLRAGRSLGCDIQHQG